jgi:hypothetical protein
MAFYEGGVEAMRITSDGAVGIGAASPVGKLSVVGGAIQLSGGTSPQEGVRVQRSSGFADIIGINQDNNAYNAVRLLTSASAGLVLDTSNNFQFNSGYGSAATAYGCRAWVNFNGTGTVAIRGSGNVSSITDNGTGSYTVNFTTAMPDVNYSVAGGAGTSSSGNGYRWLAVGSNQLSDFSMLTTSVRVQSVYDGTNKTDAEFVSVAIFR